MLSKFSEISIKRKSRHTFEALMVNTYDTCCNNERNLPFTNKLQLLLFSESVDCYYHSKEKE